MAVEPPRTKNRVQGNLVMTNLRRLPVAGWVAPVTLMMAVLPPAAAAGAGTLRNGQIEIQVFDKDTQQPVAVRMHLKDPRGRPVKPKGFPSWNDHFVFFHKLVLDVRPGTYSFVLERGPEYRPHNGFFIIRSEAADNKRVEMQRFVDMKEEGWWSGDLHIHRPLEDVPLLMLAEDLHVGPVITWWNKKNPWSGQPLPVEPLQAFDKDRFYHQLAGEDERGGGALLYFQLDEPLPITDAEREHPSSMKFLELAAQHGSVHIDVEKPFWWDAPMWIASGHVDSIGLAHNHMWRDGVLDNEAWGRPRQRQKYAGAWGNARWTTDIYYHVLNCGLQIPPSAGSASGVLPNPVGYNRVYVHCGDQLDYDQWWENLRRGRVVVTNGPLLRAQVNGELPGHVFQADAGQSIELNIDVRLSLRDKVDYLEIVKNGLVEHAVRLEDYRAKRGQLPSITFQESGWMLVRAVSNNPETYRFASTGPFYVEVGYQPRISRKSAQFFVDWIDQRMQLLTLPDQQQRAEVMPYYEAAKQFWQLKADKSTHD